MGPPALRPHRYPRLLTADLAPLLQQWAKGGILAQGLRRANWACAELADPLYQPAGIRVRKSTMRAFCSRHDVRPYRPTHRLLRGDPAKLAVAQEDLAGLKKTSYDRKLRTSGAAEAMGMAMRNRFRPWMAIAVVGAAVGTWLAHEVMTPKAGVGVPRDAAPIGRLPGNARDVTYYIQPPTSYYEFDTDQAGFEEWVRKWPLAWKQRSEGPKTVVTWNHAAGRRGELQVRDAICYGWWEGDAGWFLAYDRDSGRAYCWGNYR